MSSAAAWSVLADRFADVSANSPVEFTTHAEDTTAFNSEVIRSRILLRTLPEGSSPAGRILSIQSGDGDPMSGMTSVNRFRWLCWSAGVLLNPYQPFQPPEVSWLLEVENKAEEPISDIASRAASHARRFAESGRPPPSRPAVGRPSSWWGRGGVRSDNSQSGSHRRCSVRHTSTSQSGSGV